MEKLSLKGFIKASLYATLLLPTISQGQQDTLKISSEMAELWKKTYPRVFTVTQAEVNEPERTSYFLVKSVEQIETFAGHYAVLPDKYKVATSSSQGKFLTNELVSISKGFDSFKLSELIYYVVKGSNDSLYALPERDIQSMTNTQSQNELKAIVNKQGYKEYKDGEDFYIKSKTAEIRLDARTQAEFKKDPNYIATLDADQTKIAALVKQTVPHSKTLDQYLSLYRIQKNKISTTDINAWRTATTKAQKLLDQINKLSEKYDGNYSFTLLNKSSTLDIFLENLLASKGVLGM